MIERISDNHSVASEELALVAPLTTDLYLEHEFGHLSPQELLEIDIRPEEKLRVIALQLAALHVVHHTPSELVEWIQCDQATRGDNSYQYV